MHPDDLPAVRDKLHNLAQAAHCAAQGKVGSGFDVGAAVFGSCSYRRFSPSILEGLGDAGTPGFEEDCFRQWKTWILRIRGTPSLWMLV